MIAILGGLGAASCWAVSTLCSSRSSRMLEPVVVVAWVMLVGLIVTGPVAAADGFPGGVHSSSWTWLVLSGTGNVAGLLFTYRALRVGQVALVAPIVSTEGAIAATIALLAGESLAPGVVAALIVIAAGIALASVPAAEASAAARAVHASTLVPAMLAASCFGLGLYATAEAGAALPIAWVVLAARLIGVVVLAGPLVAAGRLCLTARAAPLLIASGVGEVLGFFSYTAGSRHGIAITAVLSSQFAVLSAIAAYRVFGERLNRTQLFGVGTVVVGVALLSALRA
jgi:drug/metabolite transporter (DMT)-like permease